MPIEYDLGTAHGKVVVDYDGKGIEQATQGMRTLGGVADQLSKNSVAWSQSLRTVSNTAALAATAIVGGLGLAVRSAADFEFQLSAIQAVSGATAKQMELVSDAALRIGKDTIFSASEAAIAMEELIKAGISVEDTLNGAADAAVAIAAAGQISLPEAASIAAAALNQFKIDAQDLTSVADVLAGAANASATGVSEIGAALTFVGPAANAAGLSLEDTATAIALLANNGIDGMRAGTALRAMLSSLSSPTDQAREAMEALGLITEDGANAFFDATGRIKPFNEIAGLLRETLSGLNEQQLLQFADTVVGRENMSSLAAIVNTTSGEFDNLVSQIEGVSAADVAAERLNNLRGKIEELRGNLETAAIMIGNVVIPRLMELSQSAINVLDWFTNLDEETQNMIVTTAAFTAGALLAVAALTRMAAMIIEVRRVMVELGIVASVTQAINNLRAGMASSAAAASVFSGAMGTLGGVITVVTGAVTRFTAALIKNPITLIVVAVAALIAAMITLYQTSEKFRAIFEPVIQSAQALMEKLEPAFSKIVDLVMELVDSVIASLVPVIEALAEALVPIIELLMGILGPILEVVADLLVALLGPALLIVAKLLEALAPIILLVLKAITPLIELLTAVLVPILDGLAWVLGVVADALQVAADWVTKFFEESSDGTSQATEAWDAFVAFLLQVWNNIVAFLQPIIDAISGFFTMLYNNAMTVWNGIMTVVGAVVAWFQEHVAPLIEAIVNLIARIFNYLWSVVVFVWEQIQAAIQVFLDWWNTNVSPVIDAVVQAVVGFFQGLWNTVVTIWNGITSAISTAVNAAWAAIVSVFGPIVQWFSDTFGPIVEAVRKPIDDAVAIITGVYDTITGFFADAGEWLLDAGEAIINGLIAGIEGALGWLTDVLNGITAMIPEEKGPEERDKKLLRPAGEFIMQGLIAGIRDQIPELRNLLGGVTMQIPSDMRSNITAGTAQATGDSRTFVYNAAPGGAQLSGEDELMLALRRSKVVVPGWA